MSLPKTSNRTPWYFWIAVTAAAVVPVGLILYGKSEAGWAALISALVVMLAARFHAIEELSLGPLRAKLSEKVREVDQAIEEVRSLALAVARPMVSMGMKVGRWDSALSRREAEDLRVTIDGALRRLEVPEKDIVEAMSDYYRYTLFDLSRPIREKLKPVLEQKVKAYQDVLGTFGSPVKDLDGHNRAAREWHEAGQRKDAVLLLTKFPNIDRLADELPEALLSSQLLNKTECEALLKELDDDLEDMRYFAKHRRIQNLSKWLAEAPEED